MEALKHQYSRDYLEHLARSISKIYSLNSTQFILQVMDKTWTDLELMDRMRKIAHALKAQLPDDFAQSAAIICKASESVPGGYLACYFPHFIAEYGQDDWDTSIRALEVLTAHSTAEFAVRPFLQKDFQRGMEQMKAWSKHPNHHVRRLSSEGARPFLPWGKQVPALKEHLNLNLEILETLHRDDSEYVRKSVSNHLNDISKINAELAFTTGERWIQNPATHRTVKHGLRTLLKSRTPR